MPYTGENFKNKCYIIIESSVKQWDGAHCNTQHVWATLQYFDSGCGYVM
jgi:hypothetical protein